MRPALFLALLFFSAAPVFTQENRPQENRPEGAGVQQSEGPPIRVVVEEVTVPFIVTDNRNKIITDLTKEDFKVFEDKKEQQVSAFVQETDVPLRVGLMIDTSNSIRDRFAFEQRAASDFLRSLLRPEKDMAFLASFDSVAELVQDFTGDLDELVAAIDSLRPGGGTALYDAVFFASRDRLLEGAPDLGSYRRALVVLSDGEDNQSRYSRLQALEVAQRAEVIVYTISTNIRGVRMPGDRVLQQFADETGGRYFQPFNLSDLDDAFQAINTELRSQYSISYQPTSPRDGKYHEIEIVPQRRGMRVRARKGYFATEPPGFVPPDPAGIPGGDSR
jgi:Ca-activated chloride channel homolog